MGIRRDPIEPSSSRHPWPLIIEMTEDLTQIRGSANNSENEKEFNLIQVITSGKNPRGIPKAKFIVGDC